MTIRLVTRSLRSWGRMPKRDVALVRKAERGSVIVLMVWPFKAFWKTVPGGYRSPVRTPLRYVPKDGIGTLIAFENQAKTQSPLPNQANTRRVTVGRRVVPIGLPKIPRTKRFPGIKEAFVPERRVRQRAGPPLL